MTNEQFLVNFTPQETRVALLQQFSTVHLAWHPRRESVRTFGH